MQSVKLTNFSCRVTSFIRIIACLKNRYTCSHVTNYYQYSVMILCIHAHTPKNNFEYLYDCVLNNYVIKCHYPMCMLTTLYCNILGVITIMRPFVVFETGSETGLR